jgi:predicted enzyme related to lactoylglutathione lyase
VTSGMRTLVYPVKDLETSKAIVGALLGAEPVVDQPYYVQFTADGMDIGLDPNGHRYGQTGPVPYWEVEDITAAVDALRKAGANEVEPVKDVGGGRLVAVLTDPDGNPIGVRQTPPE